MTFIPIVLHTKQYYDDSIRHNKAVYQLANTEGPNRAKRNP